jgi:hypothetical protein
LDQLGQVSQHHRFQKESLYPEIFSLLRINPATEACAKDDWEIGLELVKLSREVRTGKVRHGHIRDHEIEGFINGPITESV